MDYVTAIEKSGARMTPVRRLVIEKIISSETPLSAQALQKYLKTKGKSVNKTTVYRTLTLLVSEKIIKEVHLISGGVRYESSDLPHHHHLNCTTCGRIQEVVCEDIETEVERLKSRIGQKGFAIQSHNLEFYGVCEDCGELGNK